MQPLDHKKNIIEVRDISFSYGPEEVLKNISFDVHQGDYLAMVGPNGAGKTTLLKIILGLLKPKTGNVKIFGKEVSGFDDRWKIGYVPQRPALFEAGFPATVEDTVLMGRYSRRGLFRAETKEDKQAALRALEAVGMADKKSKLVGNLSGGQQQRVFLARALSSEPEIIFLDEPTVGIDEKTRADFYSLLRKLNREMGITLVLITHDIEAATKDAMHIACIDHTLVSHASPEEFLKDSQSAKISGEDVKIITEHRHDK